MSASSGRVRPFAPDAGTPGESPLDFTERRLRGHVSALAREIGERNVWRPHALHAAADYIRETCRALGYPVRPQTYPVGGISCENLEIEIAGGSIASEIVVVGAHYDTVRGSPGADDNASGVAGLLELARMLRGSALRRTVRLVAFVNEEAPFFYSEDMGSAIYARSARARGDDIRLMLSLEMLGYYSERPGSQTYPPFLRWFYPDRANFIALVANLASRRVLAEVCKAFTAVSDFPVEKLAGPAAVPGIAWSDHASFWRQRYRAVMVTDTAFYRYPHYHAPTDTHDRLDYTRMSRVVTGLAETVARIAGAAMS